MPFEIVLNDNPKTIVVLCQPGLDVTTELETMVSEILEVAEQQDQPSVLVVDLHIIEFRLDDMIMAANRARKGEKSVFRHPMISKVIFISQSKLVQLSARGLNSATFGNLHVDVYPSVDAALNDLQSEQTKITTIR